MSSTSNSQNLLVNVFRPAFVYSAGAGFTPKLVLSNLDIVKADEIQTGKFSIGDAAGNVFVGSNVGQGAIVSNASNVAIGVGAMGNASNTRTSVALGYNALSNASGVSNAIAIGAGTNVAGTNSIVLGANSSTLGSNMILVGSGLATTGDVSGRMYIGQGSLSNTLVSGNFNTKRLGIATTNPAYTLDVSGDAYIREWLSVGLTTQPEAAIHTNGSVYAENGFGAANGSEQYPAYTFIDDSGTGFYRTGYGSFSISTQGQRSVDICGSTTYFYGSLIALGSVNIGAVNTSAIEFRTGYLRDYSVNPAIDISTGGIYIGNTLDVSTAIRVASGGTIRLGTATDLSGSSIRTGQVYAPKFMQSDLFHDASGTFDLSGGTLRLNNNITFGNVARTTAGAFRVGNIAAPTIDISGSNIRADGTVQSAIVSTAAGTAAAPSHRFTSDLSSGIYSPGTNQVGIATAGVQRVVVSNANVGIGKATPVVALEVVGDVSATSYNGPGGTAGAPHYTSSDDRTTGLFFPSSGVIGFTAGSTERVRISNGNVGIGTVNPTAALEISGGALRITSATGGPIVLSNGQIDVSGVTVVSSSGVFSNAATTSNSIGGVTLSNSNAIVGGFLRNALTPTQFDISGGNISNSATHTSSNFIGTASASNSIGGVTLSNTRIGVGTSTPAYTLDVSASRLACRIFTDGSLNTNANTVSADSLVLMNTGSYLDNTSLGKVSSINLGNQSYVQARIASELQGTNSVGSFRGNLTFHTTNAAATMVERMRIHSNGNVGIGTTDPQHVLDVSSAGGNARIYGGALLVTSNNSVTAPSGLRMTASGGDSFIQWGSDVTTAGTGTGNLRFTPIFGQPEYMRIQSNGNVGIGTTAPQFRLDVSSSDTTTAIFRNNTTQASIAVVGNGLADSAGLQFYHNNSLQGIYNSNTLPFTIWTNNNRRMTILSNGNVGIGNTNPQYPLDICSATTNFLAQFAHPSGQATIQVAGVGTAGTCNAVQLFQNAGAWGLYTSNTMPFHVYTSNAERLTILSNGNVGIGRTDPSFALDIAGSVRISNAPLTITRAATAGGENHILFRSSNDGARFTMTLGPVETGSGNGGANLSFNTFSDANALLVSNALVIQRSNGFIGIGTASPSNFLHIQKGAYSTPANNTDGTTFGINFGSSNFLDQAKILAYDRTNSGGAFGGGLAFHTGTNGSSERMRINPDGTVGIGTTTPSAILDICGTATNVVRVANRSGEANIRLVSGNFADASAITFYQTSTEQGIYSSNLLPTHIYGSGIRRLTVLPGGAVGIGTSNPSYTLDVCGTIRGSSNVVAVARASCNVGSAWTAYSDVCLTILYTPKQSNSPNVPLVIHAAVDTYIGSGSGVDRIICAIRNNTEVLSVRFPQWSSNNVEGRLGGYNNFTGGSLATINVCGGVVSAINLDISKDSDDMTFYRNAYLTIQELSVT